MNDPPLQSSIVDLLAGDGEQLATNVVSVHEAWRHYERLIGRLTAVCDELSGLIGHESAWQADGDEIRFGRTRACVQRNVRQLTDIARAQRQESAQIYGLLETVEINADDLLVNSIASHMARRPTYMDLPGGRNTPAISMRNATLGDTATLGEDGLAPPVAGRNVLQTSSMQDATVYYSEII